MTCASRASSLLATLPYGVTAVAAVAVGRFTDKASSGADVTVSSEDEHSCVPRSASHVDPPVSLHPRS